MEEMTWVKAHEGEQFGDNTKVDIFHQCKTCKWRNKGHDGFKKFVCDVYTREDPKPTSILYNGDCDFYEKG